MPSFNIYENASRTDHVVQASNPMANMRDIAYPPTEPAAPYLPAAVE